MWYLRSLERAGVIQKLTILEHQNVLVLSNTRVPVSGHLSILFPNILIHPNPQLCHLSFRTLYKNNCNNLLKKQNTEKKQAPFQPTGNSVSKQSKVENRPRVVHPVPQSNRSRRHISTEIYSIPAERPLIIQAWCRRCFRVLTPVIWWRWNEKRQIWVSWWQRWLVTYNFSLSKLPTD